MNPEMIEKAAQAIHNAIHPGRDWQRAGKFAAASYRRDARAVIAAIHPTVSSGYDADQLPVGSVVLDASGESFQRTDVVGLPSLWEGSDMIPAGLMHFPATVLHLGGAA